MKTKFFLLPFVIANLFFISAAFSQATLTSDSADYHPGSTATLTGTGFQPGETVKMQVLHADYQPGDSIGADHEPWYVTADSAGGFVTTWHVCEDDCLGKLLRATADGQTSLLHAETFFTDATVTITANTNWSAITTGTGGGQPTSADAVIVKNGATLTVDVSTGVCASIQLGVNAVGSNGAAKWASNSWAPTAAHKTINGKEKFFIYFINPLV